MKRRLDTLAASPPCTAHAGILGVFCRICRQNLHSLVEEGMEFVPFDNVGGFAEHCGEFVGCYDQRVGVVGGGGCHDCLAW